MAVRQAPGRRRRHAARLSAGALGPAAQAAGDLRRRRRRLCRGPCAMAARARRGRGRRRARARQRGVHAVHSGAALPHHGAHRFRDLALVDPGGVFRADVRAAARRLCPGAPRRHAAARARFGRRLERRRRARGARDDGRLRQHGAARHPDRGGAVRRGGAGGAPGHRQPARAAHPHRHDGAGRARPGACARPRRRRPGEPRRHAGDDGAQRADPSRWCCRSWPASSGTCSGWRCRARSTRCCGCWRRPPCRCAW